MRLWSLHPQHLDSKGLIALWREGLLARAVLRGQTRGYKNHPQLIRFKEQPDPLATIDSYLLHVRQEALNRHYQFKKDLIGDKFINYLLNVTKGQLIYETKHLKAKLIHRDPYKYEEIGKVQMLLPHPIFKMIEGEIEPWEKIF
ncbi:MAG: pyrimidine dimer DNA glycosylase/endonuclease V [Methanobacteriaceae archaeon]